MNQATSRDFPRFTLIFPFFLCGHHQALNDFILFFPFDLKWNQFLIFFSLIYLVHPFLPLLLEVSDISSTFLKCLLWSAQSSKNTEIGLHQSESSRKIEIKISSKFSNSAKLHASRDKICSLPPLLITFLSETRWLL